MSNVRNLMKKSQRPLDMSPWGSSACAWHELYNDQTKNESIFAVIYARIIALRILWTLSML